MFEGLTQGERRVVDLVARGWTNQEVANELGLRAKTVEWTLTNVYRKLHLRSRTELAVSVAGHARPSNPGIPPDGEREADRAWTRGDRVASTASARADEYTRRGC